jgi:toxin CcdB
LATSPKFSFGLLNHLKCACPTSITGTAVISKLCSIFEINNRDFVALTQQLAGIDRKVLGKEIYDLSHYRSEIIASLDFIISGI